MRSQAISGDLQDLPKCYCFVWWNVRCRNGRHGKLPRTLALSRVTGKIAFAATMRADGEDRGRRRDRSRSRSSDYSSSDSEESEERELRAEQRQARKEEREEQRQLQKAERVAKRQEAEAKAQREREGNAALERVGQATWLFSAPDGDEEDEDAFVISIRGKMPAAAGFFSAGVVDCTGWEALDAYLRQEHVFNVPDIKNRLVLKAKLEVDGDAKLFRPLRDAGTLGAFWATCMDMGTLVTAAKVSPTCCCVLCSHVPCMLPHKLTA